MIPIPIQLYILAIASGTTTSPERYDFADIEARYVKITINGNNQNEWASIAEIGINAQGDNNTHIDPDSDPFPVMILSHLLLK